MKNFLLIISHLGAETSNFCSILNDNQRIQFNNIPINIYDSPFVLEEIKSIPHKLNNSAAIWADSLLYNHQFTCKSLYKFCKFIYFIRNGKDFLSSLVKDKESIPFLISYYKNRLQRMCEMAFFAGGIVVDCNSLEKSFPVIENYLNLKESLKFKPFIKNKLNNILTQKNIEDVEKIYEYYFFKLKKILEK